MPRSKQALYIVAVNVQSQMRAYQDKVNSEEVRRQQQQSKDKT